MPSLLEELKDKAQTAINATPLAAYMPKREGSTSTSTGGRSHALDALQHQIRSIHVQYGPSGSKDVRQLQLIITAEKGVILDLERESQDLKTVSKEFYVWGQAEDIDVKDVTDRLAYLTYVQGSLAAGLASSLDVARTPIKALRDAEAHMQPKRNIRANYELQITKLKNEAKPGTENKIRELESLLRQAEDQDEPLEKEIELLKRKAIVESETQKWEAIREYGEKLVLLSQASKPIIDALPSVPPTAAHPYEGAAATAAARAALQKAMDNYKPGTNTLPAPSDDDQEVRSFGETHASELSRISSVAEHHNEPSATTPPGSSVSAFPPSTDAPLPVHATGSGAPVNPLVLNNAPALIPPSSPELIPATTAAEPQSAISPGTIPTSAPTLAETGVPVVAGKDGPGPASGSLAGGRSGSIGGAGPGYGESAPSYGGITGPKYDLNDSGRTTSLESAEDEKKRLQREERERVLHGDNVSGQPSSATGSTSTATHETAEEEKKRLEKEERERILSATLDRKNSDGDGDDGNVPPPYEEPS